MAINYTQEDTTIGACVIGLHNELAVEGGTAGTTEDVVSIPASSIRNIVFTLSPNGADIDWNSGDWTTRIEVTDSAMDIDWAATIYHRRNSSCSIQETLQNDNHTDVSLGTTGVKTITSTAVNGATPSVGDLPTVLMSYTNSNSMFSRSVGITPSQNIDSPFTAVGGAANPKGPLGLPLHGPFGGPI